jgi:hypothetical protein
VTFPDDINGILDDLTDLDLFNQASLLVNFTGVGASIDLGIVASLDGTVTIPLFKSESPIGVAVRHHHQHHLLPRYCADHRFKGAWVSNRSCVLCGPDTRSERRR